MSLLFTRSPFPAAEESGADVTNFSDWTVGTRPGASLGEGGVALDTGSGRAYRYDATYDVLLPFDVYGETFDVVANVEGDEADDAAIEANGLRIVETGGGTVTYGGTSVSLASSYAGAGSSAQLRLSTSNASQVGASSNVYFRVVCNQSGRAGTGERMFLGFIADGTNLFRMMRGSSATPSLTRINTSLSPISLSITDDSPWGTTDTGTHVLEMYLKRDSDQDTASAIVDGNPYHLSEFDFTGTTTSDQEGFLINSNSGSSGSALTINILEAVAVVY